MLTTTRQDVYATITQGGNPALPRSNELVQRYDNILLEQRLSWTNHLQLLKLLGSGGQGVVYLTELRGTDKFTLPAALKIFSPERFEDERTYDEAMQRIARTSARVAQIQHDNLLYVYNFVDRHRIRMMIMEWIDGYDLARLLVPNMLTRIRDRVSNRRWDYINQVIVTSGPAAAANEGRVAVAIVRDCLNALAALHRHGIVHGDIKPSNIMLKRTGIAKSSILVQRLRCVTRRACERARWRMPRRRCSTIRDDAAERPVFAGLCVDRALIRAADFCRHLRHARVAGGQTGTAAEAA